MRHLLFGTLISVLLLVASTSYSACNPSVSKPDSIYLDNGDGTVTDNETGLMWQKCSLGLSGATCSVGAATTHTWDQALTNANSNSDYGHADWRLPNAKELASLTDKICSSPALNATLYPATVNADYWTSTPVTLAGSGNSAFIVSFVNGALTASTKNTPNYVRLVRAGY
jgi:hypothetical protein